MLAKNMSVNPLVKFNVFIMLLCASYYFIPFIYFLNLFTLKHAALYLTTQLICMRVCLRACMHMCVCVCVLGRVVLGCISMCAQALLNLYAKADVVESALEEDVV